MKRKILSVLLTVALILSFGLMAAPVAAVATGGDVTIIVQNQAVESIEGASARLLFYGGGKGGYSMPSKTTDTNGSATFTAAEIATWRAAEGYNPAVQIYIQPGAKVSTDTAYGGVRTVDPTDGFPSIPYNAPGQSLVPLPAVSFTYQMVMISTEPVQVTWDDANNEFTVTATLYGELSEPPDEAQMRLIRNLVGDQQPAEGGSDDDWYMWNGTAYERWIGIGTISAIVDSTTTVATFSQDILNDWVEGNKMVVRPEFGVDRLVGGVSCIDDYSAVDILRPSSYVYPRSSTNLGITTEVLPDLIQISITPTSLNFGSLRPGESSRAETVTITNEGSVQTTITASTTSVFYNAALTIDESVLGNLGSWSQSIAKKGDQEDSYAASLVVTPPSGYSGIQTGTIIFWAEATQ